MIAWQQEELGVDCKLEIYDCKDTASAFPEFKQSCATSPGKTPILKDGNLTLQESGLIIEYGLPVRVWHPLRSSTTSFDRVRQVSVRAL